MIPVNFKSMDHPKIMKMRPVKMLNIVLMFSLLASFMFSGCDKFEGDQEVPAYINIDTLTFSTNYSTQGTAYQELVDAWVYVNDQLIGGFEVPAEIPVLQQGLCKVEIRPGIKLNGISDTRAPYPCATSFIKQEVFLSPDSNVTIQPSFEYLSNTDFIWREDFEDAGLAIKEGNYSDTGIYRTEPMNFPGAFLDANSKYSGVVYLDDNRSVMELVSDNGEGAGWTLQRGDFYFLEINVKTTVPVLVGMYVVRTSIGGVENRPFIYMNSSDDWNKLYINFTPMVNEITDATSFQLYFYAAKSATESDQTIMFDNIKFVTRPNL